MGLISDNLQETKLTLEQSSFLHNWTVTRPLRAILQTTPEKGRWKGDDGYNFNDDDDDDDDNEDDGMMIMIV